jgi:hypothetical protein
MRTRYESGKPWKADHNRNHFVALGRCLVALASERVVNCFTQYLSNPEEDPKRWVAQDSGMADR